MTGGSRYSRASSTPHLELQPAIWCILDKEGLVVPLQPVLRLAEGSPLQPPTHPITGAFHICTRTATPPTKRTHAMWCDCCPVRTSSSRPRPEALSGLVSQIKLLIQVQTPQTTFLLIHVLLRRTFFKLSKTQICTVGCGNLLRWYGFVRCLIC